MRAVTFLAVFLLLGLGGPAFADDAKDCERFATTYAAREARVAACTRLLAAGPKTGSERARILALRGRARMGEHAAAIADLTEAIRLEPGNHRHHIDRAFAHIQAARYAEAKVDIANVLRLKPSDVYALSAVGQHYMFMGESELAVETYSRAIAMRPDWAHLYTGRAKVYSQKRMWPRSLEDYTKAIAREPKNSFYLGDRGRVYRAMGDLDRAIEDFTRQSQDPRYGYLGLISRARIYQSTGDWTKAIADATEAIRLKSGASSLVARARIYVAKGDWELAFADYARAIAAEPNSAVYYRARAKAWIERGQLDLAQRDIDTAVGLEPGSPASFSARAALKLARGRPDDAIADLNTVFKHFPRSFGDLFQRGAAYEAKGDRARALADYNSAATLARVFVGDDLDGIEAKARARIAALSAASPVPAAGPSAVVPTPKPAASPAPLGRRVALVVGNAEYTAVGRLPNPRNDATSVAKAFRSLGFADVMEAHDLGLLGMLNTLKAFGDKAVGADWAVVYFAGHGLEMGGVNYLIPVDARLARDTHVADEAVTLDRVLDKVSPARQLKLVILDACRNNPFVARMARVGGAARAIGRGLARTEPEGDVMVLYAARHGTIAEDGAGANSAFAAALIEHLPTPGLDVRLMFGRVRDAVRRTTSGRQEPFLYGSIGGTEHYFRPAR